MKDSYDLIEWRDYQLECIKTIKHHFKSKNKQYVQLPTGAGKTFIFLRYLKENSQKSIVIVPSVELKKQVIFNGKRYFGLKITDKINQHADIYVLTAASLNYDVNFNFICLLKPDHIVIDEAHHAQAKTYKSFLADLDFSYKLIGFTATPERMDGKSLNEIFENFTYDKTILDLIQLGHLCDVEAYQYKTNIQLVSRVGGDFSPLELKQLDHDKRNEVIIHVFRENCTHLKTLIFCLNIDHAIKISNYLKSLGFSSAYIHGKMSKIERKRILTDFKKGKITVLTNCQLLTEGFDEPSIEALIIARPTKSKSLYCQMVGRGVRLFPNKDRCYLYEVADNYHKICTFNVLAGKDTKFTLDYEPGERLTTLNEKIKNLCVEDVFLAREKLNIFDLDAKDQNLFERSATLRQLNLLNKNKIKYMPPVSFAEASFLIWKHRKMVEYGIN